MAVTTDPKATPPQGFGNGGIEIITPKEGKK